MRGTASGRADGAKRRRQGAVGALPVGRVRPPLEIAAGVAQQRVELGPNGSRTRGGVQARQNQGATITAGCAVP